MKAAIQKINDLKPRFHQILENNILEYWAKHTPDNSYGGFEGMVGADNHPARGAGKGAVLNTRILWTFSAAAGFLGIEKYRLLADRAYCYINDFFLDRKHGGIYWELDFMGEPINTRKQIYAQSFLIYSFAEYYRVSGEVKALETARNVYSLIEKYGLDNVRGGYLEAFDEEWKPVKDFRLSLKDINAPKTMNTHLHLLEAYTALYGVWKDEDLRNSIKNLVNLFLEKFINEKDHLVLFFDMDWNAMGDLYSFGHEIECAWLLYEAAVATGDPALISGTRETAVKIARMIVVEAMDKGGGLIYELNYKSREYDSDRHWWPQAEALVGFCNAFEISGDERFLSYLLDTWEYIENYLVDHKNGEWFLRVDKKGIPYPGLEKAGFWKCPYHNTRAMIEMLKRIPRLTS